MYLLSHNLKSTIRMKMDNKELKSSRIDKIFLILILMTLLTAYCIYLKKKKKYIYFTV